MRNVPQTLIDLRTGKPVGGGATQTNPGKQAHLSNTKTQTATRRTGMAPNTCLFELHNNQTRMAFDPNTATPIGKEFDPTTAKPQIQMGRLPVAGKASSQASG